MIPWANTCACMCALGKTPTMTLGLAQRNLTQGNIASHPSGRQENRVISGCRGWKRAGRYTALPWRNGHPGPPKCRHTGYRRAPQDISSALLALAQKEHLASLCVWHAIGASSAIVRAKENLLWTTSTRGGRWEMVQVGGSWRMGQIGRAPSPPSSATSSMDTTERRKATTVSALQATSNSSNPVMQGDWIGLNTKLLQSPRGYRCKGDPPVQLDRGCLLVQASNDRHQLSLR
ncbi:hypothetical protein LZ32DRAFT_267206 [Colletotrichum eremochloae]|nr:hypothetical protein LZ32DRAFT_267206 [Colletotrichum eremochloae]